MERTDGEVVAEVLAGNTEAYAVLVHRYREPCLRLARRLLGNREDAEDAVQEAFVRSYRGLGSYDERGRFKAWLFRILVNRCRTVVSGRAKRGAVSETDPAELAADPPDLLWRREIYRALAALTPQYREAFVLKYVDDLPYDEMADVTGVGVSALKMRVKRARAALREMLQEVYDG